jgi:hypothetical protein
MAEIVHSTLQKFGVTPSKMGYFVLDNAYNNDTTVRILASKIGFNASHQRLRCGPHTLNLIGQRIMGSVYQDANAYANCQIM